MQSPSCSPSPISIDSSSSYHAPQVLCDANGAHIDLADLYHKQQQLTIHSALPHTQPLAQMSSVGLYNASNESPSEPPIQLPPRLTTTPAPIALSPQTTQMTLQTQLDLDAVLL
jgi:hypothetical protein